MDASKTSHRGCAAEIRTLKLDYPELSNSQIARKVGCTEGNVTDVLKRFMGKHSRASLADFQEGKADVYDALQHRLLESLTDDKIAKMPVRDVVVSAAILEDKARLVRGQATGINVTVLMDVVEAIKQQAGVPSRTIAGDPQANAPTSPICADERNNGARGVATGDYNEL